MAINSKGCALRRRHAGTAITDRANGQSLALMRAIISQFDLGSADLRSAGRVRG